MAELLSNLNGWGLIALVAVAGGLLVGLVCGLTAIISDYLFKSRIFEYNTQLKHEMLDRGMSAEEIKTVLDAGQKN